MKKGKIFIFEVSLVCIASMLSACTISISTPKSSSASVSTPSVKNDSSSSPTVANDPSAVISETSSVAQSATGNTTAPSKDKWIKSTYNTPLKIGQWGTSNMYNTESHENEVMGVTLNKIVYGDAATKIFKDWISKQSVYKWEEPQAGYEYAVADISISFDGFTKDTSGLGNSMDLQTGLCCTENKDYVYYNGMKYDVTSKCINAADYSKTNVTDTQVVMLLPKACRKYVISFGTTGQSSVPIAYFAGE